MYFKAEPSPESFARNPPKRRQKPTKAPPWRRDCFKVQVHERKGHFEAALQLIGKVKTVNVIQHTRSSLSLYWAAIGFYFINQLCALYL